MKLEANNYEGRQMPNGETEISLDDVLRIRVDGGELDIFKAKAARVTGKPYQMLIREIITSFNDGRLRIIPTEEQQNGELYHVPGK